MTKDEKLKKYYEKFVEEAEMFFVTKFFDTPKIEKLYSKCLDIIYNVTGRMDPTKGIMLYNPKYGQGKSFLFDVVNHRHRRKEGSKRFIRTTARDLCDIYTNTEKGKNPIEELNKFIHVRFLFIDDIGDELKDGKERSNYGNRLNVIRHVILKRYDYWTARDGVGMPKGFVTYGTSNLNIKQIAQYYGGRAADRLLQMTYYENVDFIDGSFRQMDETRRLTPSEVQKSWDKLKKKAEKEEINLEEYFNGEIKESEEYLNGKESTYWSFVKNYLIKKGLISEKDFEVIDKDMLDASRLIVRKSVREQKRMNLRHTTSPVRSAIIERALQDITANQVMETARNAVAKRKFMELRSKNHVFE